ncbi:MAG: trypsin-like peptidase domain-containing protein [Deltaproteobacteria bacterium]|nr:trypsin-like peptidase domain-containing protein [Deltaproteobacteria bacterium]
MSFRKATGFFLLAGALGACGEAQVPGQEGYLPTSAQDDDSLHEWLVQEEAATGDVMRIQVTQDDLDEVYTNDEPRLAVGLSKDLDVSIDFKAHGGIRMTTPGFVWTGIVESAGAAAMRVEFTDFSLPDGASLYLYDDYGQVVGPYLDDGPLDNGSFWSHTVNSDRVYLQLRYEGLDTEYGLHETRLHIGEVGHMDRAFASYRSAPSAEASNLCPDPFWADNAVCVLDAETATTSWGAFDAARDATALYYFMERRSWYICSGGLIAGDTPDPFFLTANHCVSKSRVASTVEAHFHYNNIVEYEGHEPCDGPISDPVLGATLLTAGTAGDYSLLKLSGKPVTAAAMPWNRDGLVHDQMVYRISHPGGAPQAYSSAKVDRNNEWCTTLQSPEFFYSQIAVGATEGGSSGSPVYNGSGEIVGQLYGKCGSDLGNVCNVDANRIVDGDISSYDTALIPFIGEPGGGTCTVPADCDDGDACNGLESCVAGTCQAGTAVNCDDGVSCTDDSCDAVDGSCTNLPNNQKCDDGDECTDNYCDDDGCYFVDIPNCEPPPECAAYRESCTTSADCCSPMSCHPVKDYCR